MEQSVIIKDELDLLPAINAQLARSFLIDFTEYTYSGYQTKWFHELLCNKLDCLLAGKIKKLMVFMPSQHGKSEIVSRRFPAYAFGRNPDLRIVSCTYAADLATKFNRQIQRIMEDRRYKNLFPETRLGFLGSGYVRNIDEFELCAHTGSFKSVGIGGPLTGNPVDIGIIDDPVKDAVEAQSTIDRKRKWEWYNEVFLTRMHNDSRLLLTMTRWHEDDLAGRILASEGSDWEVLSLPYIKEAHGNQHDKRAEGEALWPERHSAEKALGIKRNSERAFASLLQQRPAPAEGGIFKREWWRYYTRFPQSFNKVILSWDCAFKDLSTSDYVVGLVLGQSGSDTYIIDMVRGKWDFPETVRQLRAQIIKYPMASEKLVEEKANGAAVIQTLRHEIPGIIPIVPKESKEARASSVSYIVESGCVYLPENAQLKDSMLHELSAFPNGVNDDIVDALTQALNRLYSHNTSQGLRIAI